MPYWVSWLCACALWGTFIALAVMCWTAGKLFAVALLIIAIVCVSLFIWLCDPVRRD